MWTTTRAAYRAAKTARATWYRLPAEVRNAAERDADAGRAASDLIVATAAVAYGRTRLRWCRRLLGLWALSAPILLGVGVAVGNLADGPRGGTTGFGTAFACWVALGIMQSRRVRNPQRWQQLADANQIAVDGATLRATTNPADETRHPGAETPAVFEVRRRVGKILFLAVLILVGVGYPLVVKTISGSPSGWAPYTLTGLGVALVVVFGLVTVRDIRRPVVARFTEDGWELPPFRLSGTWKQIEAITVRTAGATSLASVPRLLHAAPRIRAVVFTVTGLEHSSAQVPWHQRGAYRHTIQAFGTPAVVPLDAGIDRTADHVVQAVRSYTDTVVHWG